MESRYQSASRHHVPNARHDANRSLRLATACVVARVACNRLITGVILPRTIGRKIGATTNKSVRIDVNGCHATLTEFRHFAAGVPRNLLEVVVGIRDDTAAPLLVV